jgi:hypothetical protein
MYATPYRAIESMAAVELLGGPLDGMVCDIRPTQRLVTADYDGMSETYHLCHVALTINNVPEMCHLLVAESLMASICLS